VSRTEQGSHVIPGSLIVVAFFGLLFVVFLIVDSGASEVARAMLVIGWGLLPITLFHFVPLSFSALSWRELLPPSSRLDVVSVTWIRWIRESISSLLPVAGVGGDIVSARLAHQRGVPGAQAAASMVVDLTVGVATLMVFVVAGLTLLVIRSSEAAVIPVASALLIGVAAFAIAIAIFVLIQHRSMFVVFFKLASRLAPEKWLSGFAGSASAIDDAVVAIYGSGSAFIIANGLRLVAWTVGAGEIWLVMHFLSRPLNATDAFVLESLGSGVRAAAFMVPGALGALEGGFVLFGALLGLPADVALAISLSKRVRELALGLPGLLVWQWIEGRRLMRWRGDIGS
jgi:putative membrane protein